MSKEKFCNVYIAPEDTPMTQQEIQQGLSGPRMEDRIKALKSLITQTIHDENFPRMIMQVINTLVPILNESHQLKKIILFYWEVIEKVNPTGVLKDEMILVCNSLRNDLLHPNEYIRGRTLKLISRIQYRGILEPLQTAIVENIKHKHIYVRRNAVVCLQEIFLTFGDDLISDMDEMMEILLKTENDLSTKRNAFLLLFHCNQTKALDYLNENLVGQEDSNDFGDIMQIAILELFKKVCKADPSQKPKLLKSILHFSKSKSPSVQYECANTLSAVSPTPHLLKIAVGIYMQLIQSQTDNNIKLVVLDRIEYIRTLNPRVLEEQVLELTNLLGQHSIDIRRKVLALLQHLVRTEAAQQIVQAIAKEITKIQNDSDEAANEFRLTLLQTTLKMIASFAQCQEPFSQMIAESIIFSTKLDDHTAQVSSQIINELTRNGNPKIFTNCLKRFQDIQHLQMYKSALYVLGQFCQNADDAIKAFNQIKRAIGSLPLEQEKQKPSGQEAEEQKEKKIKVKTVILPDGTYGTQVVEEIGGKQNENESSSRLRELLMDNSFMASSLVRTLMKLLILIPEDQYNKYASQTLMLMCAIVRYFQQNLSKVDQETLEKLYYAIRVLTTPGNTINQLRAFIDINQEKQHVELLQQQIIQPLESQETIMKQPDDIIFIRQLNKQQLGVADIDFADDEVNEDSTSNTKDNQSFVSKLNHIIQLTGYSDPIYSEAFVNIHKYDITFEVLFINRSAKMVQNVQVEFRTGGDSKILEKASGVTLQPNQSARIRTSMKFSSSDIGMIHGAIHFENNAGVEQAYLVTKEIDIDLMDFIFPADIDINTFRKSWAKYEWENRISINTSFVELGKFVQHIEKCLRMRKVIDSENDLQNRSFVCANLYSKTKFDDDFLINISGEIQEGKISGFIRIRSKVKGIVVNLGEKIKTFQIKAD